jgi:hypothetical protein
MRSVAWQGGALRDAAERRDAMWRVAGRGEATCCTVVRSGATRSDALRCGAGSCGALCSGAMRGMARRGGMLQYHFFIGTFGLNEIAHSIAVKLGRSLLEPRATRSILRRVAFDKLSKANSRWMQSTLNLVC